MRRSLAAGIDIPPDARIRAQLFFESAPLGVTSSKQDLHFEIGWQ
jgi:hypothetical protein